MPSEWNGRLSHSHISCSFKNHIREFVRKIVEYEKKASFQTLREILNYMVQKGEKIIATNIKTKHNFYDIDSISDIKYAEYELLREKKEGQ